MLIRTLRRDFESMFVPTQAKCNRGPPLSDQGLFEGGWFQMALSEPWHIGTTSISGKICDILFYSTVFWSVGSHPMTLVIISGNCSHFGYMQHNKPMSFIGSYGALLIHHSLQWPTLWVTVPFLSDHADDAASNTIPTFLCPQDKHWSTRLTRTIVPDRKK